MPPVGLYPDAGTSGLVADEVVAGLVGG